MVRRMSTRNGEAIGICAQRTRPHWVNVSLVPAGGITKKRTGIPPPLQRRGMPVWLMWPVIWPPRLAGEPASLSSSNRERSWVRRAV